MVTKADLEQVPVSEQVIVGEPRGRSGLRMYAGFVHEEFQRELRGVQAIRIYDEMRRSEPVIAALMEAITTVMQGVSFEVHAGTSAQSSNDPVDIAAKEFVSKSWAKLASEELMENICTMFAFGWALFEPVYKYEEGKIWWDRLAFRGQDTLYAWEWDDEAGRVTAFVQRPAPSFKEIRIPADRFLLFRTASEKGNPEGRSLLRAAYKPYHYKRTIEEIEAIGAERDLVGIPVMNVPYNATNTEVEEARQIVERISIDEQVGVAMTATGPAPEDRFELKILSGQGSSQKIGSLERVIERYSTEMTMVALAQFLRVGQGSTGSYNLSSDQRDLFQVALRGWLRKIVRVLNSQAIPRLLAMNGMRGQCHFVPGRVSQLNLQVIANFLTSGVQNGWISPDANLEQFLRREAELPPPDPNAKPAAPPADAKDNSGLTTNPGDNQNGGSFGAAKAGGKIEGAADAKTPEEKAADAASAQKALDSLKATEPEQFMAVGQPRDDHGKWTKGGGDFELGDHGSLSRDVNGHKMLHTTSASAAEKIRESGFEPSRSSMYGRGVYFSDKTAGSTYGDTQIEVELKPHTQITIDSDIEVPRVLAKIGVDYGSYDLPNLMTEKGIGSIRFPVDDQIYTVVFDPTLIVIKSKQFLEPADVHVNKLLDDEDYAESLVAETSMMVALALPPQLAADLAIPGGEEAEELHITLAIVKDARASDIATARECVRECLKSYGSLRGSIAGYGRFYGKDGHGDVVWASPDIPGLPKLRQAVVDALEENGLYPAADHGYTPHITLAYVPKGAQLPLAEPWGDEQEFDFVGIWADDEQVDAIPLAIPSPETSGAVVNMFAEWFGYQIEPKEDSVLGFKVTSPSGKVLGGAVARRIIDASQKTPDPGSSGGKDAKGKKGKGGGGGGAKGKDPALEAQKKAEKLTASKERAAERVAGIDIDAIVERYKGKVSEETLNSIVDQMKAEIDAAADPKAVTAALKKGNKAIADYKREATKPPPAAKKLEMKKEAAIDALPSVKQLAGANSKLDEGISSIRDDYVTKIARATSEEEVARLQKEMRQEVAEFKIDTARAEKQAKAKKFDELSSAEDWAEYYTQQFAGG